MVLILLFSGYIAAFVFLLLASLGTGAVRRILIFLAMLGLIVQGGCAFAFTGIGEATGGGRDSSLIPVALFGCVPFVIWAVWLGASSFSSESSMDCPSCGSEIPATMDRCHKCGWSRAKGWESVKK